MKNVFWMVLVVYCNIVPPVEGAEPINLSAFEGKDLHQEDDAHIDQLKGFLDDRLGGQVLSTYYHGEVRHREPWFVWKMDKGPQSGCFIVFEGHRPIMVPSTVPVVIHLFDAEQKRLGSWAFNAGWRSELHTAKLVKVPLIEANLVQLRADAIYLPRGGFQSQTYGFVDSRLALIRLEGAKGEILRNRYIYPNQVVGPPLPIRTAEQWEIALASRNAIEVLEVLVWLGGRHLAASDDFEMRMASEVAHEALNEAKLFAEVWQRKSVQKALERLSQSEIKWIKEAAKLAKIRDKEQ